MKLAVKFYKDVADKPHHIPDNWPAEVRELSLGQACPEGFVIMTPEEYADYRLRNWVETKRIEQALVPVATPVAARLTLWQRIILIFLGVRK